MRDADAPCGPHLTLRADDHYVCRWNPLLRRHLYAVKHRRVAWLATMLNLYVLVSAVKMIESFQPLHVDDYAISELGGAQCVAAVASCVAYESALWLYRQTRASARSPSAGAATAGQRSTHTGSRVAGLA